GEGATERALTRGARIELRARVRQRLTPQDVVAEHAAERFGTDEVAGEPDRVRDAQRSALVAVREVEPEMVAVPEELDDVADALAADDDHDLADAHAGERLDRVVDHRPVVDGQEVLVRDDREGEQ